MLKNIPPILSPELLKVLCEATKSFSQTETSRLKASAKMPL